MQWHKPMYCNADSPMCVEVAQDDTDQIFLRDARGDVVFYDQDEFRAFLQSVKAGQYDRMV